MRHGYSCIIGKDRARDRLCQSHEGRSRRGGEEAEMTAASCHCKIDWKR